MARNVENDYTTKVADESVTTDKIAAEAVTAQKIAPGAVGDVAIEAVDASKVTGGFTRVLFGDGMRIEAPGAELMRIYNASNARMVEMAAGRLSLWRSSDQIQFLRPGEGSADGNVVLGTNLTGVTGTQSVSLLPVTSTLVNDVSAQTIGGAKTFSARVDAPAFGGTGLARIVPHANGMQIYSGADELFNLSSSGLYMSLGAATFARLWDRADTTRQTHLSVQLPATGITNVYRVPSVGTTADFVMTAGAQAVGGAKTLSALLTADGGLNVGGNAPWPMTVRGQPDGPYTSFIKYHNQSNVSTWTTGMNTSTETLVISYGNVSNNTYRFASNGTLTLLGLRVGVTTIAAPAAVNRTYTAPDVGADADFVMTAGAQTVGGAKTLSSQLTLSAAANQLRLGANTTITAPAPAAARVYTVPDAGSAASFVMTAGTQTITGALTVSHDVMTVRSIYSGLVNPKVSILARSGTAGPRIQFGNDNNATEWGEIGTFSSQFSFRSNLGRPIAFYYGGVETAQITTGLFINSIDPLLGSSIMLNDIEVESGGIRFSNWPSFTNTIFEDHFVHSMTITFQGAWSSAQTVNFVAYRIGTLVTLQVPNRWFLCVNNGGLLTSVQNLPFGLAPSGEMRLSIPVRNFDANTQGIMYIAPSGQMQIGRTNTTASNANGNYTGFEAGTNAQCGFVATTVTYGLQAI